MLSAIDTGLVGTWCVPAICALICLVVYWKDLLALIPRKATPPAEVEPVKAEEPRSTDMRPPDGFKEHVAIICRASLYAPPEVQLSYLKEGLSEAEALKAEVGRLGERS